MSASAECRHFSAKTRQAPTLEIVSGGVCKISPMQKQ